MLPAAPFLYPILDLALLGGRDLAALVRVLAAAGVTLVQVRGKGVSDRDLLLAARLATGAARGTPLRVVVNDRPDVALLAGAHGVHVGQDDLDPGDVRRLLPRALVGVSTHDAAQVARVAAADVDYVAYGPVFTTYSKANPDPVVGLEGLRRAVADSRRPVVAIGGLSEATAAQAVAAGASGVAVISAILNAPDPGDAARRLIARLSSPPAVVG